MKLKFFSLGLALLPVAAAGAAPQLMDKAGLDMAMQKGDAATVETLLEQGRINRIAANFARAALRLDFATLAPALVACRDAAYSAEIYAPAASCGIRLAGAAQSEGDPSAWVDAMAWLQEKGLPGVRKAYPQANIVFGDGLDDFRYEDIKADAPALYLQIAKGAHRLEFARHKTVGDGWVPLVKLRVNGEEITAQLDTGASATLLFSEQDAKRLGLTPLVTGVSFLNASYVANSTPNFRDGLYIAQSVTLGPLTAKNYLVTVTRRQLPFPVVGIDLLARFDRLSLDATQLMLNPETPSDCSAKGDMRFASFAKMNGVFVFDGELNGRQALLSLDTGSDSELLLLGNLGSAYSNLPVQSAHASVGGDEHELVFRSAVVPVSVGGANLGTVNARVLPVAPKNADGYLGAPFLDKYRITHDLRAGTICISKQ